MNPLAEREVSGAIAIEYQFICAVKDAWVSVGGGERHQHA
jgi:hypothetical protein